MGRPQLQPQRGGAFLVSMHTPLAGQSDAQEVQVEAVDVGIGASPASPLKDGPLPGMPDEQPQRGAQAPMPFAVFNFVNSIIGAGIIGLPFALDEAGFIAGVALLLFIAIITNYSVQLLVSLGVRYQNTDYEALCRVAFGRAGFFIISMSMFLFAYGAMCGYLIIIGDTLTTVVKVWGKFSSEPPSYVRELVILGTSCVFVLPLSLVRDIAKLGRSSFVSLIAVTWIVIAVTIRCFTGVEAELRPSGSDRTLEVIDKNFFPAIGVFSFAFICHHSSFLVFQSLENNTSARWRKTANISISTATVACLVLSLTGYLTFRGRTEGDLLNNYSITDDLMNFTRVCFALTMVLTFPMEIFVARHSVHAMVFGNGGITYGRHLAISFLLFGTAVGVALLTDNLGIVLELTGSFSATILGFIMPAALHFKLTGAPMRWSGGWAAFKAWVPPFGLLVFGVVAMLVSTTTTIVNAAQGEDSDNGDNNV